MLGRAFAVFLCFVPVLALASTPGTPPIAPRLLLVSIDGLGWTRWQQHRGLTPNLNKLTIGGTAVPLQSVFPTMTWPAHATLVTGSLPLHHGVLGNHLWSRAAHKVVEAWQGPPPAGPTIWQALRQAQLHVAAVLWPNTAGAPIDWALPEVYGQKAFENAASPGLLSDLAMAGLPVDHLGSHGGEEAFLLDTFSRDAAVYLVQTHQPEFLALHWVALDTWSHRFGPDSAEAMWALQLIDRYLGEVLQAYEAHGLRKGLRLVVVSDHGFLEVTEAYSAHQLLMDAQLPAAWTKAVQVVSNGHCLYMYVTKPELHDEIVAVLRHSLSKHPKLDKVLGPDQLVALGLPSPKEHDQAPDLVALARPEVLWSTAHVPGQPGKPTIHGMHGQLPSSPQLQGIFVTNQAVTSGGALTLMRMQDVAPTLMAWFGVPYAAMDGQKVPGLTTLAPHWTAAP